MKKLATFILAIILSLTTFAQDIEVKKFELLGKDNSAVTNPRKDINGNPCALVIVQTLKKNLEFEGWVVDVEHKNDQYRVYVANGTKHIKIKHPDYLTKEVLFKDYGVSSLQSGLSYSLSLADNTKDVVNKVYSLGWHLGNMSVPVSAKRTINMAAQKGDIKAIIAMIQLSVDGDVKWGEFVQDNKDLYWIEKMLSLGYENYLDSMPGEAMCTYACKLLADSIYKYETHGKEDKLKKMYTRICELEIKSYLKGFKLAGEMLFDDYPKSNGSPKYSKDIITLCIDSAGNGSKKAMHCLGYIYEKGLAVNQNLLESEKWYKKANDLLLKDKDLRDKSQ